MSEKLITANVWDVLGEAARESKKPASVAVAYFGKGAADLLRLPPRSRLVVDASEATVQQGQTHPADLAKMLRRKVGVYSARNLHAKVFAFDSAVFIGSANVSKHSADVLQEAVVRISDAAVRQDARDFVGSLCLEPLGPEELKRLQRFYRPPRFVPGSRAVRGKVLFSALRIARTDDVDVSDDLEKAFESGLEEAKKRRRHKRGFDVVEFYWPNPSPFRVGELIIEVHKNAHGQIVSPPGHVIHTVAYDGGRAPMTLIYFEVPNRDWEPLSRFGKNLRTILARGGTKNESATRSLLAFWEAK